MRIVWLVTLLVGATSLVFFLSDTNRAYANMLESMKAHASEHSTVIVQQESSVGSTFLETPVSAQPEVARTVNDLTSLGTVSE